MARLRRHWLLGSAAAILIVIGLFVFFFLAPLRLNQLRSDGFQAHLRQKIEQLTGLKVKVRDVEIGDDYGFVLTGVELGQPDPGGFPWCQIPKLTGQFSSHGFGWSLKKIQLIKPVCRLGVTPEGIFPGLNPDYKLSTGDLRLLGGVNLENVEMEGGDVTLLQVQGYHVLREYRVQGLGARMSVAASLRGFAVTAKVNGPVEGRSPARFTFVNEAGISMFAEITGALDLKMTELKRLVGHFQLGLKEQDMFPNLDSQGYPITLKGTGSIHFDNEAELKGVEVHLGQAAVLSFDGRFYYTDGMSVAHADFNGIRLLTTDSLRGALRLSVGSEQPLLSFEEGSLQAVWDLRKQVDDFELVAEAPTLRFHLDDSYNADFTGFKWHLVSSSGEVSPRIPYKVKVTSRQFRSQAHRVVVDDLYAAGEGALEDGTKINFDRFAIGTRNVDAVSVFSGFVETGGNDRRVDISGEFMQKFDPFAIEGIDLQGMLNGPFELHSGSGRLQFKSQLEVKLDAVKAAGLHGRDISMSGPLNWAYDGENSAEEEVPLGTLSFLQRYFAPFRDVEMNMDWRIGELSISADGRIPTDVAIDAAEGDMKFFKILDEGKPYLRGRVRSAAGTLTGRPSDGAAGSGESSGQKLASLSSVVGDWQVSTRRQTQDTAIPAFSFSGDIEVDESGRRLPVKIEAQINDRLGLQSVSLNGLPLEQEILRGKADSSSH